MQMVEHSSHFLLEGRITFTISVWHLSFSGGLSTRVLVILRMVAQHNRFGRLQLVFTVRFHTALPPVWCMS